MTIGVQATTSGQTDALFIRTLDPRQLQTEDECNDALFRIEESIGRIETQIEYADAEKSLPQEKQLWKLKAKAALKQTQAKQRAVTARKEALLRKWSAFMRVLEKELGADKVRQFWESC